MGITKVGRSIAAIARAEVEAEEQKKSVEALKAKYRELHAARAVVSNVNREIEDLELRIEHGNL